MRILPILIILLFLAGCNNGGGGGGSNVRVDWDSVHSGKDGLVLTFGQSSPPSEIGEGKPIKIAVIYDNEGAYDVKNGKLFLTVEPAYIQLDKGSNLATLNVNGKNIHNVAGDFNVALFDATVGKLADQQKYDTLMTATACYSYATEARFDVCIDTDIYNVKFRDKVCTIRLAKQASQGGPVAVTSMEQKLSFADKGMTQLQPEFIISVANVGVGEVVNPAVDVNSICTATLPDSQKDVWGVVKVSAQLAGQQLVCEPGMLSLVASKSVVCRTSQPLSATRPSYSTALTVKVEYNYIQSIAKKVSILQGFG